MKGRRNEFCRSFLFLATCCQTFTVGSRLLCNPTDEEHLRKDIGHVDLKSVTLAYALERTLDAAQVSGGIARVQGCEEDKTRDLPVLGPTLRDALTAIQKVPPDYTWRVNDGVVNVFPVDGMPAFLRTSVRQFDSQEANNVTWATSILMGLPEVRGAESKLKFGDAPNEIELGMSMAPKLGGALPPTEPPLAVRCKECTVYGVLNALVHTRGHGLWIYEERHCGGMTVFHIAFSK